MSVLIKEMKMPNGCKDCILVKRGNVYDICPLLRVAVDDDVEFGGSPRNCPLIELPDHGDLIDIDSMLGDFAELRDYDFASREYVVIPAERSEASLCICDNCDQRNDKGCSVCKYINERSEDE